jgi:hypothetical protein
VSGLVGKRVCVGVPGLGVVVYFKLLSLGPVPRPPADLPCFESFIVHSVNVSAAAI